MLKKTKRCHDIKQMSPTKRKVPIKWWKPIALLMILVFLSLVALLILRFVLNVSDESVTTELAYLQSYRSYLENWLRNWQLEEQPSTADSFNMGSSIHNVDFFIGNPERGFIMQEIVGKLVTMKNTSFEDLQTNTENQELFSSVVADLCPSTVTCSSEVKSSPYRTLDGSCNNVNNPDWGMSGRPQLRLLPPDYDDGFGKPRRKGHNGTTLPNPRFISNVVFKTKGNRRTDVQTTILVMAFGQFLSHDLSLTPVYEHIRRGAIDCCNKALPNAYRACIPIPIPYHDGHFSGSSCMSVVRSLAAPCRNCKLCKRHQVNNHSSYIDASNIYGATAVTGRNVRLYKKGLLKQSPNKQLLPSQDKKGCVLTADNQFCFMAGDKRANVVPNLSILHIIFVREHNRIASRLLDLHPAWDDEKLFQETRRIVIAVMQNIVYSEYLPVILGADTMKQYGLEVAANFNNVYDNTVDASIAHAFSTAAFRFGHTTVPDTQQSMDGNYSKDCISNIKHTYNNPNMTFLFCDGISRWLTYENGIKPDGLFGDGVRNDLFLDKIKNVSFDLPAINIHRGRDHGIPAYNKWRQWCRLPEITAVDMMTKGKLMGDFSIDTADKIRVAYSHPDDIDLFTGAISETNLPGGQVGPTFACIIGDGFRRLKVGDRYFYENPATDENHASFTIEQLLEIKNLSFPKVICENMYIENIQLNVFRPVTYTTNPFNSCTALHDIDLTKWNTER